ncbi:hypothetical protein A1O1_05910 [Capronia coronata CBS 617.96]|uniref:Uncharacterized protein n=1 Tax=Capronia coronata CBS 617.96 TaxID=1182541 RepID=W9Y8I1_9EURO|nr:uncharacterized protein A1O1_05910 [Capronia coronata CBS 617.96]EXJ85546.1 hypothetical protein A1O1_05910 [Capronia coronata CBS 617.96]
MASKSKYLFDMIVPVFDLMFEHHRSDVAEFITAAQLQPDHVILDLGTATGVNGSPILQFDVVFLVWTLCLVDPEQRIALLHDLPELVKPGGKLVFDWQSPEREIYAIQVNYGPWYLALYPRSEYSLQENRHSVVQRVREAGWNESPNTTAHPMWQSAGYEDITQQVLAKAERLAAEGSTLAR